MNLGDIASIAIKQDWDLNMSSCVLTAIALAKGQLKLGEAILNMDSEDVIEEFLQKY